MIGLSMLLYPVNAALAASPGLSLGNQMQFGSFESGAGTGTIQIQVNNSRVITGSVTGISSTPRAAVVRVTGDGSPVVLTISPASTIMTGPGTNMTVDTFQIQTSAGGPTQTVTPAATTTLDVAIGGTLHVNASQGAGSYTGTFVIDATFQ